MRFYKHHYAIWQFMRLPMKSAYHMVHVSYSLWWFGYAQCWQNLLHSYCLMTVSQCLILHCRGSIFSFQLYNWWQKTDLCLWSENKHPSGKVPLHPIHKEKSMYNQMAKSGWQFSIMTQLFNTTIFTKIWIRLSIEEF
jgi:hypothetical protein